MLSGGSRIASNSKQRTGALFARPYQNAGHAEYRNDEAQERNEYAARQAKDASGVEREHAALPAKARGTRRVPSERDAARGTAAGGDMIEQRKTRVWRLDDQLPAKEPERAQPVGGNDSSSSERSIEPQRVIVIQLITLPAQLEHEGPRRLAQHAQQAGPRARHAAEAWAAGANIGAKTELRRDDAEIMQAVAHARARRKQEASASSIVIPKMPAVAKLALLKDWLMRQPKPCMLIASALTLALGVVPLLLRASDDAPQAQAAEKHPRSSAATGARQLMAGTASDRFASPAGLEPAAVDAANGGASDYHSQGPTPQRVPHASSADTASAGGPTPTNFSLSPA